MRHSAASRWTRANRVRIESLQASHRTLTRTRTRTKRLESPRDSSLESSQFFSRTALEVASSLERVRLLRPRHPKILLDRIHHNRGEREECPRNDATKLNSTQPISPIFLSSSGHSLSGNGAENSLASNNLAASCLREQDRAFTCWT